VAGHHARAPGRPPDQRLDELDRARVEVRARLVEQQQRGVVQDRAAHGRALGEAPRQRAHRLVAAVAQAGRVEQLLDPLVSDPVQPRVEAQVLADAQLAVEQRVVAEQADVPAHRPALADDVAPEHPGGPGVRAQQGGEDPQSVDLPAPLGPKTTSVVPRPARASRRRARRARRRRGPAREGDDGAGRGARRPAGVVSDGRRRGGC
jgi:hypothetical protein